MHSKLKKKGLPSAGRSPALSFERSELKAEIGEEAAGKGYVSCKANGW